MRKDFPRVIISRPRRGSHLPNAKTRLKVRDIDDDNIASGRVSSSFFYKSRHLGEKETSDLISPLDQYLKKNVGRPWNKVYSEIRRGIDVRRIDGWHFLTHIKMTVEKNCILTKDGEIRVPTSHLRPMAPVRGFFIHPETGLLCYRPWNYKDPHEKDKEKPKVKKVRLSKLEFVEEINGVWYFTKYGHKYSDDNEIVVPERKVGDHIFPARRVKDLPEPEQLYLVSKKQINKKELRKLRKEGKIL